MTLAARIFIARVQATRRKAARKRHSDLERELAGYATPAERCDLVRGHEKVPVCGQVEVSAGGQLKVPIPRSSCRPGG